MKSQIKDFVSHSHKEINFNLETHTFDIWTFRPDNYSSNPLLNKTYGLEGQACCSMLVSRNNLMTMEVIPEPWHKLGASWNISEEIEIREQTFVI